MIIVTGALGFIGSNLLAELELRGYEDLVSIDTFGTDDKWKNVAKRSCISFVFPDQTFDFINKNKDNIKALIHLGAISSTTEKDVDLIARNNIQLTMELYQFCTKNRIPFIYASSAATYGHGKNEGGFLDDESLDFLQTLRPLNPYGWSKLSVDKLIAKDKMKHPVSSQVVGLKFFNVYGPNEYHKGGQKSVIPQFFKQYQEAGYARLFITNGAKRDFVFVDDCVDVMIWMLEHPQVSGLFNVGTGVAATFEDVAECVAKSMGIEPNIKHIEMPEGLARQYQFFTQSSTEKLRSVGYPHQMHNISQGVEKYVKEYLLKGDDLKYR